MRRIVLSGLIGALLLSTPALASGHHHATRKQALAAPADQIYFGGDILTMATRDPRYAEAVAVRDGKIAFVGAKDKAMKLKGKSTTLVDLKGHTLLPGFIDGHGHMIYYGKNMVDADLVGVTSVAELVERMKAQAAKMGPDDWIVGFGYSVPMLKENRHPTAAELDAISGGRPIMVVDSSGHNGAATSGLFKLLGLDARTKDPEGGSFLRNADGSLAGPLEETALFAVREKRPSFTGKLADEVAINGSRMWARYGQTTAQECGVGLGKDDIDIIRNAIDKKLLPIDLYLCAKDSSVSDVLAASYAVASEYDVNNESAAKKLLALRPDLDRRYINRVRPGGIKMWLDGSIPTAWFTEAYAHNPPGKDGDYRGFPQVTDDYVNAMFDRFWKTPLQINMHMNGDAAADQALHAIELAIKKHGMADSRPVFIHATYMRPDQIALMKKVGGIPTFTTGSVLAGGDVAITYWGKKRTDNAMPIATLEKMGVKFSLNHDAPILPKPDVLALVDAAVNRTTASGVVFGPEERATPYVALKGVTAYPAFQIKEEKTKGTLEKGKLADLVILEQNPLKVDPKTIKDIKVLETIKEGKTVYVRE